MARGTETKTAKAHRRRRQRAVPVCRIGLLTRREAADLTGTSLSAVNKAIEQRTVPIHREGKQPLLDADGLALLTIFDRAGIRLPVEVKQQVKTWIVGEKPYRRRTRAEMPIRNGSLAICVSDEVRERALAGERYVKLRDRHLVSDPDILGGAPVIRGTRMLAETVRRRIDGGDAFDQLEAEYPMIPPAAFRAAYQYAKSHPRRGRPAKPWQAQEA